MEGEEDSNTFKIVLIGEAGVGKTSIISQFIDQTFQEDLQASTGGTFTSKTLILNNGNTLKFDIWDTAGQERYRALTKLFYKDSNAAILVYDITRQDSFDELKNYWAQQIQESTNSNIILAIAANKSDLIEKEEVDEETARKFAQEINAMFYLTSAKNSMGIDDLFFEIAKKHIGRDDITIRKGENEDEKVENVVKEDEAEDSKGAMKITAERSFSKNKERRGCC